MRRFLDRVYTLSGAIAACFMVAIFVVVVAQVGLNIVDFGIRAVTGESVGLVIPSYAEIAGFFLAAASFFALPYALRHGIHIRVTLVLMHMPQHIQTVAAVATCLICSAVSAYFSYYCWELILESHEYGDLSSGLVAIPLWIPQLPLGIGSALLAIALFDSAFRAVKNPHDPACLLVGGE